MSLYNALAEHPDQRDGKEVYVGSTDLDSNGEIAVSPGFATIDAVLMNIESETSPDTDFLTWSFDSGVVTIHGWDGGSASAGQETVSYAIIGRRR